MILFEKLRLGYGSRILIDDLSATIEGGALNALVGRNGTGKSTLLRAIVGLQERMAGDIRLQGRSVGDLTTAELAQAVAFVTTDKVRIANLKCRDVVALGRAPYTNWIGRMQEQDRKMVELALEMVGMADFADKTMDQMSDGECQRVMIARALAQETPIILLDEPTAFLDMPNRYEYMGIDLYPLDFYFKCKITDMSQANLDESESSEMLFISPEDINPDDFGLEANRNAIKRYFNK